MPCMPFSAPQSQSAPKVQLFRSTLLASNSLKIAGKNWFIFVPPKGTGSLFLFHTEDMSYTSLENISMIINDMQIMHMTYYVNTYIYIYIYAQYYEDTSCFCSKHSRCIDIFESSLRQERCAGPNLKFIHSGWSTRISFMVTTTKQATGCASLIEPVLEAAQHPEKMGVWEWFSGCAGQNHASKVTMAMFSSRLLRDSK